MINKGIPPFYEPQLETLLKKIIKNKNLKALVGRKEAILETDTSFITVGTPSNLKTKVTDPAFKQASIKR